MRAWFDSKHPDPWCLWCNGRILHCEWSGSSSNLGRHTMSYASHKGYIGERNLEAYLDSVFKEFGYTFERRGGQERFKKTQAGDVVPVKKGCLLDNYFLESKRKASVPIFDDLEKAEDDAKLSGKWGAILFATQQRKGEHGRNLVVMTRASFERIVRELQGYREQETK